ncbi:MAG: outer membrane protein transport protein [Gammaproteobacteria bacterium]|nr:outer membrane protein transport protein [Gammaproteobacteria bacterium]
MRKKITAGFLLLSCYAHSVHATQVFDLEGFGATSRAMGGTSASYYTGNAGLVSNPATLQLAPEGRQFELGLDVITTDIQA